MSWVVGVDPGSRRHAAAFYLDGKLTRLAMLSEVQLVSELKEILPELVQVIVEDVSANNYIYSRNEQSSKKAHAKVARNVGQNQNAQKQLIAWLDHYGIPYRLIKPQGGNWAKNKRLFEHATKWLGNSNKDTRSAAFFGMLGVRQQ